MWNKRMCSACVLLKISLGRWEEGVRFDLVEDRRRGRYVPSKHDWRKWCKETKAEFAKENKGLFSIIYDFSR